MNIFEEAIVNLLLETDYYGFLGDKELITLEACQESIANYSHPFSWTDKRSMQKALLPVEEIPTELVLAACEFAWAQLDWEKIANAVKEQA